MVDIVSSPVSALLQSRNVPFEQIVIPLSPDKKPIRALEEILGEHGYLPGSVVRSILFRTDVAVSSWSASRASWLGVPMGRGVP